VLPDLLVEIEAMAVEPPWGRGHGAGPAQAG
jgi:hypothetical protein